MKSEIRKTLIQKLNDALVTEVPELTRREIRLPAVPGKAIAVIGLHHDLEPIVFDADGSVLNGRNKW
jgi:hypothetical protein